MYSKLTRPEQVKHAEYILIHNTFLEFLLAGMQGIEKRDYYFHGFPSDVWAEAFDHVALGWEEAGLSSSHNLLYAIVPKGAV